MIKKTFPRTIEGENVSIEERLEFVRKMFEKDSDLDNNYLNFFDYLRDVKIDYMSKREQQSFYRIWEKNFKPCVLATDYLTSCKGNKNKIKCYDDEGLDRLYVDTSRRKVKKKGMDRRTRAYRERSAIPIEFDDMGEYEWKYGRDHSIKNISDLRRKNTDMSISNFSDVEFLEYISFNNECTKNKESAEEQVLLAIEKENLIDIFTDKLERQIAELIIQGKTQKYIYESLGITKSKLDTILHSHMKRSVLKCFFRNIPNSLENQIAKMIFEGYSHKEISEILNVVGNNATLLSTETKFCNRCSKELSIDLFGNDSRKKDGKQSICKLCDSKRKQRKIIYNNKISQEII